MRFIERVSVFILIGFAAAFGLTAVFKAQAQLDQQAELYVKRLEAQQAGAATRNAVPANAPLQPVAQPLPSTAGEGVRSADTPVPGDVLDVGDATASVRPDARASSPANEPGRPNTNARPRLRETPDVMLAEGKKAVTIRVSNGEAVVVLPGRWVDVVLTHQPEKNSAFSDVIVQNARVLAIDPTAGGEQSVARSVTLEVDIVGAQKLLLASRVGTLSLILRRPDELHAQAARRIGLSDLDIGKAEAVPEPDNARSTSVTVNRRGAGPSVYRVPRE